MSAALVAYETLKEPNPESKAHFKLAPLWWSIKGHPSPYRALEPYISYETLKFHYLGHHQTYVTNLNNQVDGKEQWKDLTLKQIILQDLSKETPERPLFNNAAQIYNHDFYWQSLAPPTGEAKVGEKGIFHPNLPTGHIAGLIDVAFKLEEGPKDKDFKSSFDKFKAEFKKKATAAFGSGWIWLVLKEGKLEILETHDADSAIRHGVVPLLAFDVWEHAYYVDYRNKRVDYIDNWWSIVNWKFANENLEQAHHQAPPSHL
eukprot:TRINITY_DN1715_c0_g1_i1.p1 TRINITY_DN1715_c0_g1~~TRINITY_DN1715_c0_g1_i1.p1  ORF type:complete len:298 (-),score=63.23 TRINITY_DN1715_c0_g1_i1:119-898(-)